MALAPIVLFVYNRPELTRACLESIQKNPEAANTELHIFADGPKTNASPKDRALIEQTRRTLHEKDWCKSVSIVEAEKNKGLMRSIVDGVTSIINRYNKVLVFEDDMVLSEGCLSYLNNALDLYQDEDKVMHVSSFMFPVKQELPETFFYMPTTCSGGWATWKRAWDNFEEDPVKLLEKIREEGLEDYFNLDGHYEFLKHLELNADGKLSSWAIRWQASVILNGGLSLHPGRSLVQNNGFGELAEHSKSNHFKMFHHEEIANNIPVEKIPLRESPEVREIMKSFYDGFYKASFVEKIRRKFVSIFIK